MWISTSPRLNPRLRTPASMPASSTSPATQPLPCAIYVIDKDNAVAIPLGGSNSETETLLRFIHQ